MIIIIIYSDTSCEKALEPGYYLDNASNARFMCM